MLARLGSISKEVQGPDGRYVRQALPYRTRDNRIEGVVITFSDVARSAQEARLYAEAIVNTVREPLLVLDLDLHPVGESVILSDLPALAGRNRRPCPLRAERWRAGRSEAASAARRDSARQG